jgi:hypothetical protein
MRTVVICWPLLLCFLGCAKAGHEPNTEDHIKRLEQQVEPQRKASAQVVAAYAPKLEGAWTT